MSYFPISAVMPDGTSRGGLRRILVGEGLATNLSGTTLAIDAVLAPEPQPTSFRKIFTHTDLLAGVLLVVHNLDEEYPMVQVWNDTGLVVVPDEIAKVDSNITSIALHSFGNIDGNWRAVLIK